jgi:hypothetical protein
MANTGGSVHLGSLVQLKAIGLGEHWLQDWLVTDPRRLGLGEVKIIDQEQTQVGGGVLDILATSGDTYYSIEVQLGEVDASHGFRVFDYWARNRRKQPTKAHVAVLVAESASGRYRTALEALAEFTPLLVIELRAWRGAAETVIVPELVIKNATLDVAGTLISASEGISRTQDDWKQEMSDLAWGFHLVLVAWVEENLGKIKVDYAPKSYVGLWVGRRVWCPIWPVSDGGSIHLPDPDGSKDEESPAYEHFRERLLETGLAPSWTPTYNGGANPITLRLKEGDLGRKEVQELLRATYEHVRNKTVWSETSEGSEELDTATGGEAPGPATSGTLVTS